MENGASKDLQPILSRRVLAHSLSSPNRILIYVSQNIHMEKIVKQNFLRASLSFMVRMPSITSVKRTLSKFVGWLSLTQMIFNSKIKIYE